METLAVACSIHKPIGQLEQLVSCAAAQAAGVSLLVTSFKKSAVMLPLTLPPIIQKFKTCADHAALLVRLPPDIKNDWISGLPVPPKIPCGLLATFSTLPEQTKRMTLVSWNVILYSFCKLVLPCHSIFIHIPS